MNIDPELIKRLEEAMNRTDEHNALCSICIAVDAPYLNISKLCNEGKRLIKAELAIR